MKNLVFLSLVILVTSTGCREFAGRRERGSGHITTETRSTSGFNSVNVSGAIELYVKQDSSTSVKIETDDNVQQYIIVENNGETLDIYTESGINIRSSRRVKVYVSSPLFKHLEASGACSLNSENLLTSNDELSIQLSGASKGNIEINAPTVGVNMSGASHISLKGTTKNFSVDASGASDANCFDLLSENTTVDLSGASHADVYASVSLTGQASGASHVAYKGNANPNVDKSGASGVSKSN